jgi:hypothetical protein
MGAVCVVDACRWLEVREQGMHNSNVHVWLFDTDFEAERTAGGPKGSLKHSCKHAYHSSGIVTGRDKTERLLCTSITAAAAAVASLQVVLACRR